jgi:hypothetical protein
VVVIEGVLKHMHALTQMPLLHKYAYIGIYTHTHRWGSRVWKCQNQTLGCVVAALWLTTLRSGSARSNI